MVTMASIPSFLQLARISSEISRSTSRPFSSDLYLKGLPRFVVPRIVPPRGRIRLTRSSVSSNDFSGQMRPSKPSGIGLTFQWCFEDSSFRSARIRALRPGSSPPPAAIPTQPVLPVGGSPPLAARGSLEAAPTNNEPMIIGGQRVPQKSGCWWESTNSGPAKMASNTGP